MKMSRPVFAILLSCASVCVLRAQDLPLPVATPSPAASETIPLVIAKGTLIQLVLDQEVRVRQVGQPLHGRVLLPVYAFDRLVIPAGSEVTGRIAEVEEISSKQRTLSILNADFTPARKIHVEFNDLVLADGRHLPLRADITAASGQVIQFVSAGEADQEKKPGVKQAVSEKVSEAKDEVKRDWETAKKQVKEPGKMHRLKRFVLEQLPARPQYLDAGTLYFAELLDPLDFGSEQLTPEAVAFVGTPPPTGSLVHALLLTPLSSATTQKGALVEAVLSQPLFSGEHLIFPQGTHLHGSVAQVQPARRLRRNGQLRIAFHDLVLPDGIEQKVDAVLEGVEAAKADQVKMDDEGGAHATNPKSRYLATGLSLLLAAASTEGGGDRDAGAGHAAAGETGNRAAGGATGFKLVGIAVGAFVHSRPLGVAMGAYGASMSVYSNFLGRGRDVVFPKDTAIEIGLGIRGKPSAPGQDTKPTK